MLQNLGKMSHRDNLAARSGFAQAVSSMAAVSEIMFRFKEAARPLGNMIR
jgi:hypothetical protein